MIHVFIDVPEAENPRGNCFSMLMMLDFKSKVLVNVYNQPCFLISSAVFC